MRFLRWIKEFWWLPLGVVSVFMIVVGHMGIGRVTQNRLERLQHCSRILECLDVGVTRDQCDALFPACKEDA